MTRAEKSSGYDKAVLAAAGGVVRYAGWARGGWAPYGKIVYIEHKYRDRKGTRFQTLYAHLNRVLVKKGQRIKAGMVIGTLGGSSRRKMMKFGPHLHFAMYRNAKRTLGGGQAVVPEPIGHHEDLRQGMVIKACSKPGQRIVLWPVDGDTAQGGLTSAP